MNVMVHVSKLKVLPVKNVCVSILLLIAYCDTSGQATISSQRSNAQEIFQETLTGLIQDGDRAKARAGFLEAARTDPTYALPRFNLGVLAEADEQWDAAIRSFEEFLSLSSDQEYKNRAGVEIKKLRQSMELDKTPAGRLRRQYDQLIDRTMVYLDLNLFKEAVATAAQAATLDSSRWEAYAISAGALIRYEQWKEALDFINVAMKYAPPEKKKELMSLMEKCRQKATPNN
jgi:tetratricopeptide (TPR) repeat protein